MNEKRREPRREATGVVHVRCAEAPPREIEGRLMDVSPSGFRMSHGSAWLATGQVVEFSYLEASGRARVMWTRILAEQVETGFLVVA
jgi:PilZ domain